MTYIEIYIYNIAIPYLYTGINKVQMLLAIVRINSFPEEVLTAYPMTMSKAQNASCHPLPPLPAAMVAALSPELTGRGKFRVSRKLGFRGSLLLPLFFGDGWPPQLRPGLPWKSYLVVFRDPSSGIFSSEQLLPESRSRCSSSLKRSATHWAVSRASGSWSQHSVSVSHTIWMPW